MAPAKPRKSPPRKAAASKPSAPRSGSRGPTPLLEWISAAIGLAALVLIIGLVASEAFKPDNSPPAVRVEQLGVTRLATGYLVEVRAFNDGGSPAAQVVVEGRLSNGDEAEATFDFIADHSSSDGGLFFGHDPRTAGLTLRAKGYAAP